ncbi:MAG TPA: hypothetical protein EYH26_02890 [Pyrodictium sp.]|nr:hypothetical protein [Pyrodictium sp.]
MLSRKLSLAVLSLSACGGCDVQILRAFTLHEELQKMYDIVYWSFVLEKTKLPSEIDVALVNGAVRTEEDLAILKKVRNITRRLIVVGTCGGFGGISGQADYWPIDVNLKAIYGGELKDTPKLLSRVYAPADIVDVDYIVTNCPPRIDTIASILKVVYEGKELKPKPTTVCSQCPRKMREIELDTYKPKRLDLVHQANSEDCLLVQGYLCLGPVTYSGCGAVCPSFGLPCFGCGGPGWLVAVRRDYDILPTLVRRLAVLGNANTIEDENKLASKLVEAYKIRRFYIFTIGSSLIRGKPRAYAIKAIIETRKDPRFAEALVSERKSVLGEPKQG